MFDSMKNIRSQQQSILSFCFTNRLNLFWLAFLSFFLLHSLTYGAELKDAKRVLILFPGQSDLPAYPKVIKGIKSSLKADTEYRIDYFIEYMDLYRNPKRDAHQYIIDLNRYKFSGKKVDLIIAYSAPSLSLVVAHGYDPFPRTPVVFTGILREQLKGLNIRPMVTGVLADVDYAGLLETALKIHPQTRQVAIVNGASKTDLLFEKEFRKALDPYAEALDFIYLTRLPFGQILERVRDLPDNTVILFYLLTRDGEGKGFAPWRSGAHRATVCCGLGADGDDGVFFRPGSLWCVRADRQRGYDSFLRCTSRCGNGISTPASSKAWYMPVFNSCISLPRSWGRLAQHNSSNSRAESPNVRKRTRGSGSWAARDI